MFSLEENPLIAAIRTKDELESVLNCPCSVVFVLNVDILNLAEYVDKLHSYNKAVFIHIDLAEGIGKDSAGLAFVAKCGVDGIISTRNNIIKMAKECNLKTVQRFFIVDSHSIQTAHDSIKSSSPDMIEIMPGILPSVIKSFKQKRIKIPIIAGGLIETKQQIIDALDAGAYAISTAKQQLWYM